MCIWPRRNGARFDDDTVKGQEDVREAEDAAGDQRWNKEERGAERRSKNLP